MGIVLDLSLKCTSFLSNVSSSISFLQMLFEYHCCKDYIFLPQCLKGKSHFLVYAHYNHGDEISSAQVKNNLK